MNEYSGCTYIHILTTQHRPSQSSVGSPLSPLSVPSGRRSVQISSSGIQLVIQFLIMRETVVVEVCLHKTHWAGWRAGPVRPSPVAKFREWVGQSLTTPLYSCSKVCAHTPAPARRRCPACPSIQGHLGPPSLPHLSAGPKADFLAKIQFGLRGLHFVILPRFAMIGRIFASSEHFSFFLSSHFEMSMEKFLS